MNLAKVKEWLKVALLMICCIGVPNLLWNLRLFIREGNETMKDARRGVKSVSDFAEYQTEQLQSEKTQKVINANLELGAAAKGSVQAFNRLILPRLASLLEQSQTLVVEAQNSSRAVSNLLVNTDRSLNQELLPQTTALLKSLTDSADQFGLTVEAFNTTLSMIANHAGMTLDQIYNLLADPHWKQVLANIDEGTKNLVSTSRHVDATAAQIEEAMKQAPSIAVSLEKIAKTSSKFQKTILIVGILSTIARAFLP